MPSQSASYSTASWSPDYTICSASSKHALHSHHVPACFMQQASDAPTHPVCMVDPITSYIQTNPSSSHASLVCTRGAAAARSCSRHCLVRASRARRARPAVGAREASVARAVRGGVAPGWRGRSCHDAITSALPSMQQVTLDMPSHMHLTV